MKKPLKADEKNGGYRKDIFQEKNTGQNGKGWRMLLGRRTEREDEGRGKGLEEGRREGMEEDKWESGEEDKRRFHGVELQWFFMLISWGNELKYAGFGVFVYHNLKMDKMTKLNSSNGFRVNASLIASESEKNILKYCKISSLLIAEFRISYLRIQN